MYVNVRMSETIRDGFRLVSFAGIKDSRRRNIPENTKLKVIRVLYLTTTSLRWYITTVVMYRHKKTK